jgi:hypothetical protein
MFVAKTWNQRLFAYESFQEPKTRGSLIFEFFTKNGTRVNYAIILVCTHELDDRVKSSTKTIIPRSRGIMNIHNNKLVHDT